MPDEGQPISLAGLSLAKIDPDSPVPLYHQIEEDLRRLIITNQLPAAAPLPPELALGEAYGVGRHTMRMALSRLAADGLISRRAGRGTFVVPQPDRAKFYLDRSFTQQMAELGREARTRVINLETGVITGASPEVFVDRIGAKCLHLTRLRFGDDEPIGIQRSILLTGRCPDLARQDFARTGLYDILAREYNLGIVEIQHAISATVADAQQARALQINRGDPLLIVNTTTFLTNHELFEYTTSYYRADKYEYSTTHRYNK